MPAAMVMSGNELAAVMFWRALLDDSFPVRLWIDAVKNPAADHSEGLAILRKWAQDQGQKLDSVPIAIPLAFEDYQEIRTGFGIALWAPLARGYRQSKYFKQMAREKNYLSYWRENGFPAECHAVGDDDFECQ